AGLLLTLVLLSRRVPGALLLGILGSTLLAVAVNAGTGGHAFPAGVAVAPARILSAPDLSTFGSFDFGAFARLGATKAGLLVFAGSLPGVSRVLVVASLGAVLGGAASASSNTCYVESASGVAQGGRTGLMSVVVGALFLASVFLAPVVGVVPKEAIAPV